MGDVIVIGVGNPLRGDDGAGWAAIEYLEKIAPTQISLRKQKGDIAELIDAFSQHSMVYLIDACEMEAPLGSWQRIDALLQPLPVESNQTSTHGFGISQAIALAQNMNLLPSKLIVYVISGRHYTMNATLSPPVAEAAERVAREIYEDIIHA